MPRFSDEWLIDRVLFDYVSGGSCACCGFQHFLPNGTADLINAVSDLETDQASNEVLALENHPWPADLRDQIWADRVRLRQKLKKEMSEYQAFWDKHHQDFRLWCLERGIELRRLLQLPRAEVVEVFQQRYNIHSAYGVVLCQVLEQVVNFPKTGYPIDARGESEVGFEKLLTYDRRCGFTLPIVRDDEIDGVVLDALLNRIKTLGGPKLLEKGSATSDEGDADDVPTRVAKPGFQSDRRLVRLLIARYWADLLRQKFLDSTL